MKLSSAQLILLHVAESSGSAALITLLVGILQGLAMHQINPSDLLTVFGAGFVAALGLIYKTVRSDPHLAQAESDTLSEIKSFMGQHFALIEAQFSLVDAPTAKVSVIPTPITMPVVGPPPTSTK